MTPDPSDTAGPVSEQIAAVLPWAAIVAPVAIAVLLFIAERRSAERARQQQRQDQLLEEIIAILAFFVSVNPTTELWLSEFRQLRAKVTILQTLPNEKTQLLAQWIALEGDRGKQRMLAGMAELERTVDPTDDVVIAAMQRTHDWAAWTIHSIAGWMRGIAKDEMIRERIAELKESLPPSWPPVD